MSYDLLDRVLIAARMFRLYRRNGFSLRGAARQAWERAK